MKIVYTHAMVRAALDGSFSQVATEADPIFGVHVPVSCPGVPNEVLKPRNTWRDAAAYDAKAKHLAGLFRENFKQFEAGVSDAVKAAGPKAE